eukprot:COSAG01_NODE_14240_length_1478_cov_5.235678_2_plen_92_part_00
MFWRQLAGALYSYIVQYELVSTSRAPALAGALAALLRPYYGPALLAGAERRCVAHWLCVAKVLHCAPHASGPHATGGRGHCGLPPIPCGGV